MVTYEHDIAQFAKRNIIFRDDKIRRDEAVADRARAADVLKTVPVLTVRCEFTLPQTEHLIRVDGTVVWSYISGRSGIKFEHLGREDRDTLDQWSQCQASQGW